MHGGTYRHICGGTTVAKRVAKTEQKSYMWGSKVTKREHKTSKNLHAEEQKWERKGWQKTGKNMFGAKTFLICLFITFLSPRWGAPKRPPQDLAGFGATFGRPQDLADFGTRFCRPWAPWPIACAVAVPERWRRGRGDCATRGLYVMFVEAPTKQ